MALDDFKWKCYLLIRAGTINITDKYHILFVWSYTMIAEKEK